MSVVVAMDPPYFGQVKDTFQFLFERPLWLKITKEYYSRWTIFKHCLSDMIEESMLIAAKEDTIIQNQSPLTKL